MVKRVGTKRKTRHKLKKPLRMKGKLSMVRYFQQFKEGEKVTLKTDSSVHEGLFCHRFHGITGTVFGKQGNCYQVHILDGNKQKTIVVHPVHLQRR